MRCLNSSGVRKKLFHSSFVLFRRGGRLVAEIEKVQIQVLCKQVVDDS